jgi:uncharacterized membrane protein
MSSLAAIGGPATSAALCQANDWKSILIPSLLLVGNIGYEIATSAIKPKLTNRIQTIEELVL